MVTAKGHDLFLAKLKGSDGTHVWSKGLSGEGLQGSIASLAVAASKGIVLAGSFAGKLDLDCGVLDSNGVEASFLAKLDEMGTPLWAQLLKGPMGARWATGAAFGASNQVLVSGYFTGEIDFGGGVPVPSAGGQDIFWAKFGL